MDFRFPNAARPLWGRLKKNLGTYFVVVVIALACVRPSPPSGMSQYGVSANGPTVLAKIFSCPKASYVHAGRGKRMDCMFIDLVFVVAPRKKQSRAAKSRCCLPRVCEQRCRTSTRYLLVDASFSPEVEYCVLQINR